MNHATTAIRFSPADRWRRASAASLLAALFVTSAVALACVAWQPRFEHWFLFPVIACGGIVGWDALRWFRGRADMFEPYALVSLISLHLFVAAPLLHVGTDYWLPYITPPADWRPWLGYMACINVVGLLLYRVSREFLDRALAPLRPRTVWQIDLKRFVPLSAIAIAGGMLLQMGVYARFGGVSGYIQAFSDASEEFVGMGAIFMFSEAVPIVALIAAAVWVRRSEKHRTLTMVLGILAAFVALKFICGGLRGSRGHFIYGLFWAAVVLHQKCHRLPKKLLIVGVALFLPFMYAYGLYKSFGTSAVDALDGAARADLMDSAPRGMEAVLLGDLARSDVQAFMLYRMSLSSTAAPYKLAMGQTYVGTLALLVPRQILPDRPPTKVKAGTDLLFGPGVFENEMASTFAYGITGEAMLNFGVLGAVLSFGVIAVGVVVAQRWYFGLHRDDSRGYVLPLLFSLTFMALLWDTDVLLFYTIKEGAVPGLLIVLSSRRVSWPSTSAAEILA